MEKFNWEEFEFFESPGKHNPVIASLTVHPNGLLNIGKKLKDAGFDTTLRYKPLFDKDKFFIGLCPDENGYKVTKHSPRVDVMRIRKFCEHFNITGKFRVKSFEKDGDIWVLPLTQIVHPNESEAI